MGSRAQLEGQCWGDVHRVRGCGEMGMGAEGLWRGELWGLETVLES